MKDVAQHAGVSVSTVSYVLNESGPVAPARRERVMDAVRVLNYTPNSSARSLKRQSASAIGLVVPDLSNQYFALLTEGVARAAADADVSVVLCAPEVTGEESLNAKLLRSQRLDGIIYLSSATISPTKLIDLTQLGWVVLVDERMPGFDLPAVVSDNRRGARDIARYVLEQGHRDVAVLAGPNELWTAQQRLAGYREALAGAGLDPDAVPTVVGDYHESRGYHLAEQLLAGPNPPTALLCANDLMAVGVLEYARTHGLSAPQDISVVGFDDVPFASLLTPRLTTVRQPAAEMGRAAADILFALIRDDGEEVVVPQFDVELKIRDSVAPPKPR
jgi:LacI family transcriptional regulator